MLETERQEKILAILKTEQSISVKKLVKTLFVSEATIRRDLNELEKTGALHRVYGGAMLTYGSDFVVPLFIREREEINSKKIICEEASKLIKDGNIIILDGSSTAQYMVEFLPRFKDIVVITNGAKVAQMLGELHIKTFCTGGLLMENSSVFVGKAAMDFVSAFNVDICFLSSRGITEDGKISDTSLVENELRQIIMKNSKTVVFMMTGNKIGTSYIHNLCNSTDVDYIFSDITLPETIKTRKSINL